MWTWNRWDGKFWDGDEDVTEHMVECAGHVECAGNRAVGTFVDLRTMQVRTFGGASCGRNLQVESGPDSLTVDDILHSSDKCAEKILRALGAAGEMRSGYRNAGVRRTSTRLGDLVIEPEPGLYARVPKAEAEQGRLAIGRMLAARC